MNYSSETTRSCNAFKSGKDLENRMEGHLVETNYLETNKFLMRDTDRKKAFSKQVTVEKSITGKGRICDFLIKSPKFKKGLIIEAKHQTNSSNMENMLIYTALSMVKSKKPGMLVLDGGGFSKGLVIYLKELEKLNKNFMVRDFKTFCKEIC